MSYHCSILSLALIFSFCIYPIVGATFDAKSFFLYIDQSCTDLDTINNAADDMNAMVAAAQESFDWTPLREMTYAAYWGKVSKEATLEQNSGLTKAWFGKLGTNMESGKYSLYCDGTALTYVTTQQEGGEKGEPWADGKGRWYFPPDRRAKDSTIPYYIVGDNRSGGYCAAPDDKPDQKILGASSPGQPYIIMCPSSFTGVLNYQTLSGVVNTVQPLKTRLDSMVSTGAVMLHEFTHAVLATNANSAELYGTLKCLLFAKFNAAKVRKNADTFMLYSMASYLQQNAWVLGLAEDKNSYNSPAGPAPPVRKARHMLDVPLYPRGTGSLANTTLSGTGGTGFQTSIKPTTSSSSPSGSMPGFGILPFPTTTSSASSSSGAPTGSPSFSGTWTDKSTQSSTPTSVVFGWFDIPTTTVADTAATSEGVLLGGLFLALKGNRLWLTDPNLKSQYINDVKKTKDEALALFNDLSVKPPEAPCSNTKKKRNVLSERKLRTLLRGRDVIQSMESSIVDAVGNAAKLISCGLNVVDNLVDSVEADTPDVDLVENLTDTLAEIGVDLEDEGDDENKSTASSSISSTKSSSSSSSSSSTDTAYIQATEAVLPATTDSVLPSASYSALRNFIVGEYTEVFTNTIPATSIGTISPVPIGTGSSVTVSSVPIGTGLSNTVSPFPIGTGSSGTTFQTSIISPTSSSLGSSTSSADISNPTGNLVQCYSDTKTPNITFTLNDATAQIKAYCTKYNGQEIGDSQGSTILTDTVNGMSTSNSLVLSAAVLTYAQCSSTDPSTIKIETADCESHFLEAVNNCDLSTQTLKYGGVWNAGCIQYRIQGWNQAPQTDLTATPTTTPTPTPMPPLTTSSAIPSTTQVPPPTITAEVFLGFEDYEYEGLLGGNQWDLFTSTPGNKYNACNDIDVFGDNIIQATDKVDVKNLPWPDGTFKFREKVFGESGCVYTGTQAAPGTLTCDNGFTPVDCIADPQAPAAIDCGADIDGGITTVYPKVICQWG